MTLILCADELIVKTNIIPINLQEMELVNGLRLGCEGKFKLLYKMYAPALKAIIMKKIRIEEAAEDVLQETFIKIWNNIGQYQPARGRLYTWLAAAARNSAIDHLRSKGHLNCTRNSNIETLYVELIGQLHNNYNPDLIGIRKLATNVNCSGKEILDLIYFQGYTHTEVAEQLNIPIGTVKTRLRKAIKILRAYF